MSEINAPIKQFDVVEVVKKIEDPENGVYEACIGIQGTALDYLTSANHEPAWLVELGEQWDNEIVIATPEHFKVIWRAPSSTESNQDAQTQG